MLYSAMIHSTKAISLHGHGDIVKAGSQYDERACIMSCHLRVDACRNAWIDLDSILAFLCVAFLRLVMKKSRKFEYFCVSQARRNTTQGPCIIL